ncbi:2-methylisocitrate lyase [Paraburkholderia gardini]|uniref:2-methylisocitrate lyase n=1 Tax=Paraburkholderia gardini TaxID=2823469 RepID=A0ABM8U9E2_9BURK|nr:2-methylisocitrate lyase [Paraburkholderia gardini]
MKSQSEKAQLLRTYHENKETFVIPNPWDIGSARLLALAGFKALATSSAGYAFTRGLPDNSIGREQMMLHLAEIASATDLPVSADLENGFGDAPQEAAETISPGGGNGRSGRLDRRRNGPRRRSAVRDRFRH